MSARTKKGNRNQSVYFFNVISIYFVFGMKIIANEGCLKMPGASSSTFVVCDVFKRGAYDDVLQIISLGTNL